MQSLRDLGLSMLYSAVLALSVVPRQEQREASISRWQMGSLPNLKTLQVLPSQQALCHLTLSLSCQRTYSQRSSTTTMILICLSSSRVADVYMLKHPTLGL